MKIPGWKIVEHRWIVEWPKVEGSCGPDNSVLWDTRKKRRDFVGSLKLRGRGRLGRRARLIHEIVARKEA
jgi:hypothetical protein